MTRPIGAGLSLALALALDRSQSDITEALALLRESRRDGTGAEELLARAISRLEMMRVALGRRDDGSIPT